MRENGVKTNLSPQSPLRFFTFSFLVVIVGSFFFFFSSDDDKSVQIFVSTNFHNKYRIFLAYRFQIEKKNENKKNFKTSSLLRGSRAKQSIGEQEEET